MQTVYIRHFNAPLKSNAKCLALQTFQEVECREVQREQFIRGFYMNFENNVIGIVGTKDGPMHFWGPKFYLLRKGNFSFRLENRAYRQWFTFEWNNTFQNRISYSYTLGKNRLSNDFFYWLAQASLQEKFYRFYAQRTSQNYDRIIDSISVDYKQLFT